MSNQEPLRVLIVEDTLLYRTILIQIVSSIPGAEVVGTAASGEIGLERIATIRPDVVLLDIFMPDMDGLETLREMRARFPDVAAVMISGATHRHADITIDALQMGAVDFVQKPREQNTAANRQALARSLQRALKAVRNGPNRRPAGAGPATVPAFRPPTTTRSRYDLIVIGSSVGGPNALSTVIPALPANLPAPVLIVQHMPAMFTTSLAGHLNRKSQLYVSEAKDNDSIDVGRVYLAPGDHHMTVRQAKPGGRPRIHLTQDDPINSCRPSVDVLLFSIAEANVGAVLIVILTGMGADGADGLAAFPPANRRCLIQNRETCVVYGMPRSVAERGLADESLPLDEIAPRILSTISGTNDPTKST